jgi:chlorobactene glucosyltransferase
MHILGLFISAALLVIGITILSNLVFFPRLQDDFPGEKPFISILIPARDECEVIQKVVLQVLAQTYTNFELIVLDDQSSDNTAALAIQAAKGNRRFQLIPGQTLPAGWLGKNWACHQLSRAANGEFLLFLDADVNLTPNALSAMVAYMNRENAGLLTTWPTQRSEKWGERLIVPLINFAILSYLPILAVHFSSWPAFAAANGQCMLFRRTTYQACGGHAAVRNKIVEDVALAQKVKAVSFATQKSTRTNQPFQLLDSLKAYFKSPLRMIDGNLMVSCHMYPQGWTQVKHGLAKNLLAGHGNQPILLLISTIFHWLIFIVPWVWWILGASLWALGLGITGLVYRAITALFTHQRLVDTILMPVSVLLMTRIAAQSLIWHYKNSTEWKGRKIIR